MSEKGFFGMLGLALLLVWPMIPGVPHDYLSTAILACGYVIVAISLVLLIGLVGQVSLAQASLVGMGAFVSALAVKRGIPFPFTILVGGFSGAVTAIVLGFVGLRVRGLYLAVATLIFAYMCDQYLFSQPWLVGSVGGTSIPAAEIGQPGTFPYFDLADAHIFYYPALALAVATIYAFANIRDSKLGRAFAAIRGSEVAAASMGIDVMRFKLIGFACAGAMAGIAGTLILSDQRNIEPAQFTVINSLFFLSVAAVGGFRSAGGAIASALIFAVLVGEVFFHYPKVADFRDLISSGMLIAVLLFFRGGLGAIPSRLGRLSDRLGAQFDRLREARNSLLVRLRLQLMPGSARARTATGTPEVTATGAAGLPAWRRPAVLRAFLSRVPGRKVQTGAAGPVDIVGLTRRIFSHPNDGAGKLHLVGDDETGTNVSDLLAEVSLRSEVAGEAGADGRRSPVLLEADGITVKFGGLTAVNNASLRVGAGEIVGLIGPNGAGKTTMFNSILGLNQPTAGSVHIYSRDVTSWPVHRRAALGVGRTFQLLQLLPDLSIAENLMVATHLQNRTGLLGILLVSGGARRAEAAARARVQAVMKLMDLEQYGDRPVAGLPFGVLRQVEVARTMVAGPRLVCFDEPASGLDSAETEKLIEWFRLLREIGITLLVIEHDVDMVSRLCDHIYVLDQGTMIASGTPAAIRSDPAVIASYLGTTLEAAS